MLKRTLLAVACVSVLLAACGGSEDFDPATSAQALEQLRSAQEAAASAETLTYSQEIWTRFGGRENAIRMTVQVQSPDKTYARIETADQNQPVEYVVLGDRVYLRQWSPTWLEMSLEDMGVNPAASDETFDLLSAASGAEILDLVEVDGRTLRRVRVVFDGDKYRELMSYIYLDTSVIGSSLEDATLKDIETEFLLDEAEHLVRGMRMQITVDIDGEECTTKTIATYGGFGEPVEFPSDLPVPLT